MNTLNNYSDSTKVKDIPVWWKLSVGYGKSNQEGVSDSYTITNHRHLRGDEYKKYGIVVEAGIKEAIMWWMNHGIDMSNTKRIGPNGEQLGAITNIDNLHDYIARIQAAEEKWMGRNYVHFAATNTNIDQVRKALKNEYVAWVKIYPEAPNGESVTTSYGWINKEWVSKLTVEPWWVMDEIADACIEENKTCTWHSETPGMWAKNYWWGELPIAALHSAIERIIALSLRKPKLKLINAHTSLMQEAEMLIEANQKLWTNIWIELSPQYMLLSQEKNVFADSYYGNSIYKCFPNIRKERNNTPLISLLDHVGEDGYNLIEWWDHAPHPEEKKRPFTFAVRNRDTAAIVDILNFVYNEWKTNSENKKLEERKDSFPYLFDGDPTKNIAEVLNKLSSKHRDLSLEDRENRINFIKWFGWLPNLRDIVPLRLTIANKSNMTVGQFKQFIGNSLKDLHETLIFDNTTPHTFTKVDPYRPDYDYYDGVVINPWKNTDFTFKKTA